MTQDTFQFERIPLPRPKEYEGRVVHREWLTPDTLKVAIEPTSAAMFDFVPGQYVSIVLEEDETQGLRRELRPYSLWNHPDEFEYAVTILKIIEGGRATTYLKGLAEGEAVKMVGPLGSFYLRRPLHPQLYFVATGTGVVPMRAMIKDLVSSGEIHQHDVTLLFGVRHEDDLFETQELERFARKFPRFTFLPTLSQPTESWTGARGRVTAHLEEWDLPLDDMQIYLCGNGAMIDEVTQHLDGRGLNRRTRRVVYEKYFDA